MCYLADLKNSRNAPPLRAVRVTPNRIAAGLASVSRVASRPCGSHEARAERRRRPMTGLPWTRPQVGREDIRLASAADRFPRRFKTAPFRSREAQLDMFDSFNAFQQRASLETEIASTLHAGSYSAVDRAAWLHDMFGMVNMLLKFSDLVRPRMAS